MYVWVPACLCTHHVCACCLWKPEEGVRSPGTQTVVSCTGVLGTESSFLQEQQVPLSTAVQEHQSLPIHLSSPLISPVWFACVCVYVRWFVHKQMFVCAPGYMNMCVYREYLLFSYFWDRVSYWICGLSILQEQLLSELQISSSVCLPSASNTWRSKLKPSCLCRKHFTCYFLMSPHGILYIVGWLKNKKNLKLQSLFLKLQ